jgi:hypothetical protein
LRPTDSQPSHHAAIDNARFDSAFLTVEETSELCGARLFPTSAILNLLQAGIIIGLDCGAGHWMVVKSAAVQYAERIRELAQRTLSESSIAEKTNTRCDDNHTTKTIFTNTLLEEQPIATNKSIIEQEYQPEVVRHLPIEPIYIEQDGHGLPKYDEDSANVVETVLNIAKQPSQKKSQYQVKHISNELLTQYQVKHISNELLTQYQKADKRLLAIDDALVKGAKLELSANKRPKLVIKAKSHTQNLRCVLGILLENEDIDMQSQIKHLLNDYQRVHDKLERRPATAEFKLHSKKIDTLGDVLNIHVDRNIVINHGGDSNEVAEINRLVKNHLSKNIEVKLAKGRIEHINLLKEKLPQLTPARFKTYMSAFRETTGVHDKILSRISAGMNFCILHGLLKAGQFMPFHTSVNRISIGRHVSIENEDLNAIGNYLRRDNFKDERTFREFRMFMRLEMSGSLRTQTTVNLKYSQFDMQNCRLKLFAKGGKPVVLHMTEEMIKQVSDYRTWQQKKCIDSIYLFPSPKNQKPCKNKFSNLWDKLREELGFVVYEKDPNSNKKSRTFKYVLHDFRETMLSRVHELDDLTLSKLLGHLSTNSLKHYRQAMAENVKQAAQLQEDQLNDIIDD